MPMGGLFCFCATLPIDLRYQAVSGPSQSGIGESIMSNQIVSNQAETTDVARKAAGLGISLDGWAVALALGLALLVWAGWIKQVPW
jgi:hypothetical protein